MYKELWAEKINANIFICDKSFTLSKTGNARISNYPLSSYGMSYMYCYDNVNCQGQLKQTKKDTKILGKLYFSWEIFSSIP